MQSFNFIAKSVAMIACLVLILSPLHVLWRSKLSVRPETSALRAESPSVAKVSAIYGEYNEYYERAVSTHERHAERHGYPCHILRNPVAPGEGHRGYWNKMLYLQSMLVQELGKPEDFRAKWLMWFDADSIIINEEIPVEIFLPPTDFHHIHFLVTKDENGLNSGVFFLRVDQRSVALTTKVLGFPIFRPEVDLGFSADQQAMALVLQEPQFLRHTVWQPRLWYNTYQRSSGYEGKRGNLLVHFPGLEDRWTQMSTWLNLVSHPKVVEWHAPLGQTTYPADVDRFWSLLRRINTTLEMIEDVREQKDDTGGAAAKAAEDLESIAAQNADSLDTMETATEAIRAAMEHWDRESTNITSR